MMAYRPGENVTIECGIGKQCSVICGVYGGCGGEYWDTTMICNGKCNATCEFDGICPVIVDTFTTRATTEGNIEKTGAHPYTINIPQQYPQRPK